MNEKTTPQIPFCSHPFVFFNIMWDRLGCCCPGWQDGSRFIYYDEVAGWTLREAWNHPKLIEWRQALLSGDFRFCQRCPNRFRWSQRTVPTDRDREHMEAGPVTVELQDNPTCNLACPSCRSGLIVERRRSPYSWRDVLEAFPDLDTLSVSCAGDPFANWEHRQFLESSGSTKAIIWTNGILAPRFWPRLRRRIEVLLLSLDATDPGTYEQLRKPAKWSQAIHALQFLADRRQAGEIARLQCNFVVQAANYAQMPAFVEMCLAAGADCVQFTPIAPWPHMSSEQWENANVADPRHPNHMDYIQVLASQVLWQPSVDMGLMAVPEIYAEASPGNNHFRWRGTLDVL